MFGSRFFGSRHFAARYFQITGLTVVATDPLKPISAAHVSRDRVVRFLRPDRRADHTSRDRIVRCEP